MAEGIYNSVVCVFCGHIIGSFLDAVIGIAHCYAYCYMTQHPYVISTVAKSHCFGEWNPEMLNYFVDADTLVAPARDYIAEVWIPACRLAFGQHITENTALDAFFLRPECHHLHHIPATYGVKVAFVDVSDT